MAATQDFVAILEQCYQPIERDKVWLAELFRTMAPSLDLGGGMGMFLIAERPQGRVVMLTGGFGRANDIMQHRWASVVAEQMPSDLYRHMYYPRRPVIAASALAEGFPAPFRMLFAQTMKLAGATDLIAMLGYPAPGFTFSLFFSVANQTLTPGLRDSLRKLRIHVEAAVRLRMFADDYSAATLSPDGKVLDLAPELRDTPQQTELSARARAIEGARAPHSRTDAARSLAVWNALVEGRWSLVEKIDSDGKRLYHAFENAPNVRTERALNETESVVVDLFFQGLSGKEVAYNTGLSRSRVSNALASGAARLGFRNRSDLLRAGARLSYKIERVSVALTSAEHDVLALVQQGFSNREIAQRRNSSQNTVANQVAMLLRKTGASGRRALVVMGAPNGQPAI